MEIILILIVAVVLIVTTWNRYNMKRDIRMSEERMTTFLNWFRISNEGEWKRYDFEKGELGIDSIKGIIKRNLNCFYPLIIDSITEVEFKGKKYIRIIYKDDDKDTIKEILNMFDTENKRKIFDIIESKK